MVYYICTCRSPHAYSIFVHNFFMLFPCILNISSDRRIVEQFSLHGQIFVLAPVTFKTKHRLKNRIDEYIKSKPTLCTPWKYKLITGATSLYIQLWKWWSISLQQDIIANKSLCDNLEITITLRCGKRILFSETQNISLNTHHTYQMYTTKSG